MSVYSYSKINSFQNCPRQFKYKYIDKLEVEGFESIEAFMGSRVHEALKKLYQDKQYYKLIDLSELLEYYREQWEKNWHKNVKIVKDYKPKHYEKIGENCIKEYYNTYKPFDKGKTLGLELKVNLRLKNGTYKIIGYIDRLTRFKDRYEIHDYKTSHNLPNSQTLKNDIQLGLYALAVLRNYKNVEKLHLVWHYLTHNERIEIPCPTKRLKEVKEKTIDKINKINKAIEEKNFPAKESGLCNYCEFQSLCPLFKHKFETEDLEPNEYLNEKGVKLVNKYAELKAKKKELEEEIGREIKKVEKALVSYVKKNNLDKVYGSDVTARVKTYKIPYFPRTNEPGRRELEDILKENEKLGEVTSLNLKKLSYKFKKKEWNPKLISKLRKYASETERSRIYLSKKEKSE